MPARQTIGHALAFALALLWTAASQAYFTPKLTPDMARGVDRSMKGVYPAFKPTAMSEEQIKHAFGTVGLVTAYLLLRRSTRNLGFGAAIVVTLVVRVYPSVAVKNLGEAHLAEAVGSLLAAAFGLGLLS